MVDLGIGVYMYVNEGVKKKKILVILQSTLCHLCFLVGYVLLVEWRGRGIGGTLAGHVEVLDGRGV